MRYAMIMAGGSGTRLWPMSTAKQPKQLIPFIQGRSLLQIASDRLEGLVAEERQLICAGQTHKKAITAALPGINDERYLAEPVGRDTLNAVGFGAAIVAKHDPDAVIAVFTADHIITPVDEFKSIVDKGFQLVDQAENALCTFGISPTEPATGYGYLQLGEQLGDTAGRVVDQFKEKPNLETATEYVNQGADKYLWNSGMFVWKASTLLACIKKYHPENHKGLMEIANAWGTPDATAVLERVYPTLPKVSVDYAVMEPASQDDDFQVAAVPMPLSWLDVGSWPAFGDTCPKDSNNNALAAKFTAIDSKNNLVASDDPEHLITMIGCEDMVVIHTDKATLICPKSRAEEIKALHSQVGEQAGEDYL